MADKTTSQKVVVVGAGPVGALAALYSASRGDHVEVYEFRGGKQSSLYFVPELVPEYRFLLSCRICG